MREEQNTNRPIEFYFRKMVYWNFGGSIVYEIIKTLHNFFIIRFLSIQEYGLIGTVLSIIYLSVKMADIGTTHALPPFFSLLRKDKNIFSTIFLRFFIIPLFPAMAITAAIVTYICYYNFLPPNAIGYLWIVPALVFLETLRSFLRYFLHFSFQSHYVVSFEVASFFSYIAAIWIQFLWFRSAITPLYMILLAHLVDSLFIVCFFIIMVFKYYRALPAKSETQIVLKEVKSRINKMRIFNYLLRVSRELFTNHFLTPFFALRFGLPKIGLFFFAGSLATSIQSVLKAVIGYSGTALFANVKEYDLVEKKKAFQLLFKKLMQMLTPLLISIIVCLPTIITISKSYMSGEIVLVSLLLFCILISIEFFFMLYEQFYIMEESAEHLFMVKLFEFFLLYMVLGSSYFSLGMVGTFAWVVGIRFFSFFIIVVNAYYRWRMHPSFSNIFSFKHTAGGIVLAYLCVMLLKKLALG